MTIVKICGLKRVEHALAAAKSGADMLGFVFAPSRRQIDAEAALAIARAVRPLRPDIKFVGVFVNERAQEINSVAVLCGLDYAQLSGDEGPDTYRFLDIPVIKTVRIGASALPDEVKTTVQSVDAELVHLDTAKKGAYGGTGERFDWSVASGVQRPFLLAGGLDPANVIEAIAMVRPWGVDVSSGVERDGEKDPDLVEAFIAAARAASAQMSEAR